MPRTCECAREARAANGSARVVVLTGAGISTAAGIQDEVSSINCSDAVAAGPGKRAVQWALHRLEKRSKVLVKSHNNDRMNLAARIARGIRRSVSNAYPTRAHMGLTALKEAGFVETVVTTNIDGLHRMSGFPKRDLVTLRGDPRLERCSGCGREFTRDFDVTDNLPRNFIRRSGDHSTGRRCADIHCRQKLEDVIIFPNERIPESHMQRAYDALRNADVLWVVGSSLREKPAYELCMRAISSKKCTVAICGLQLTAFDNRVDIRIHESVDVIVDRVQQILMVPESKLYLPKIFRVGNTFRKYKDLDTVVLKEGVDLHRHEGKDPILRNPNGEIFVHVSHADGDDIMH